MTERDEDWPYPDIDPNESPFPDVPAIEGMPFERGSAEDQAIQRIKAWETEPAKIPRTYSE